MKKELIGTWTIINSKSNNTSASYKAITSNLQVIR
jgi:hypothetical protein